jgi:O-acetyl-ADP-ribose deacetylase (regulator of RNase III)
MMTERSIHGLRIDCVQGDITDQPGYAAVVNAANAQLRPGGGVAGAIHLAAGPGLDVECRRLAPIQPGEAVLTGGHDLPNKHVIHCLGPVYGRDEPSDELLEACYRNALKLAEEHALESIAFPAISTGAFGFPLREAAEIAMRTVADAAPSLARVRRIRFTLFRREALDAHAGALERLER